MAEPLKKEDIKEAFKEAFGPYVGAIKGDFNRVAERFDKIDKELGEIKTDVAVNKVNIQEGFKEAKIERTEIKTRINETYNAVDGFIKIVTKLEQEFTVIKEDLKRVKEVIKEKLGVDLT